MTVPNLKELFGHRYRISYDQAVEDRNDPWMLQIPSDLTAGAWS
jgi:hypothetical protein